MLRCATECLGGVSGTSAYSHLSTLRGVLLSAAALWCVMIERMPRYVHAKTRVVLCGARGQWAGAVRQARREVKEAGERKDGNSEVYMPGPAKSQQFCGGGQIGRLRGRWCVGSQALPAQTASWVAAAKKQIAGGEAVLSEKARK